MKTCERCNTAIPSRRLCEDCRAAGRKATLERYNKSAKNKANQGRYRETEGFAVSQERYHSTEAAKETRQKWRQKNRHKYRDKEKARWQTYYQEHRDEIRASQSKTYRRNRAAALAAYGAQCVCCGEDGECFLTFDHVNDDGAAHREEIGTVDVVKWLRSLGFPRHPKLQVLCYNCNFAKQHDPEGHCMAHPRANGLGPNESGMI